ncbi:MAG TPA: asparagine synthase (glutamine-hydrolyzing) [Candidatus Binatia bacterium]|jgi:asparagine synthase (glutamine-hydrolysing)
MCGIFGLIDLKGEPRSDQELMAKMGAAMVHRGPDDAGVYFGAGLAFGMRRLSIIDLEGGHQPIANEDDSVWVVCNGEIYNYRELRLYLEQRGHRFRCRSDTEVIVHLYEEMGTDLFKRLRGMFAIAIWDSTSSRLVLARDRLGKKPLYVARQRDRILFASEIKAILQQDSIRRELNLQALKEYLALGYVPAPLTLFEGIEKVLPGYYLVCERGAVSQTQYWDVKFEEERSAHSEEEWAERVREKLLESVKVRLVSDVPLGAFLSGGIDSSAVVAAMAQLSDRPVKTYSIGFEGEDRFYNELPYAGLVARKFGTEHHEIVVRPDVGKLLPKLIWHMDEPIADSAFVTTYLVSQLASQSVKVILSGVGGDELFGGYRRYLGDALGKYYKLLPSALRTKWLPALFEALPRDRHSKWKNLARYAEAFVKSASLPAPERYSNYVTLFSADLRTELQKSNGRAADDGGKGLASQFMQRYFDRCPGIENLNRLIYVDLKMSLPDDLLALTDKMTMATSLECRAPFMDHELVELAAQIPVHFKVNGFSMKYILKKAVSPWLPDQILHRKKRGFGAPIGAWLRRDLKGLVEQTLSEETVRKRGLFEWPVLRDLIRRHEAQEGDYTDHLLALINLELWFQQFMDGRICPPTDLEPVQISCR